MDAAGESLGRVCSKIAKLLRGKYKPNFTPHVDCGDNVIVINADKVVLTGKKWDDRVYLKFSGYPGGQRQFSPRFLQAKGSDRLFRKVVKGMLPKNRLGAAILANLYVYDGAEHKHEAQQPRLVDLSKLKEYIPGRMEFINAIGRRKAAVARVYVAAGSGKITINKRDIAAYFPSSILQYIVRQPLATLDAVEKYDIKINLKGGGFKGQSEAARLAIARALVKINEEDKPALRAEGFLTRDSRVVERKKPGRPKARKRFQFSKR